MRKAQSLCLLLAASGCGSPLSTYPLGGLFVESLLERTYGPTSPEEVLNPISVFVEFEPREGECAALADGVQVSAGDWKFRKVTSGGRPFLSDLPCNLPQYEFDLQGQIATFPRELSVVVDDGTRRLVFDDPNYFAPHRLVLDAPLPATVSWGDALGFRWDPPGAAVPVDGSFTVVGRTPGTSEDFGIARIEGERLIVYPPRELSAGDYELVVEATGEARGVVCSDEAIRCRAGRAALSRPLVVSYVP